MALILIIIIFIIIRMYLLTNFITMLSMLMIPMQQALSPFQVPCFENTNVHAELNTTWLN